MSVSDRGMEQNLDSESPADRYFIPEFKEQSLKNILTSIIFIDKRRSIDPEMGAYISHLAAGLAAKEMVDSGWHSEPMKEVYLEAISNLATIPMIITTTYVDPGMTNMALSTITNNLLHSLEKVPFTVTADQQVAITADDTHEILGDIRDAVINIEEYSALLPDDTAKIYTAGIKLASKSIAADPLLNSAPILDTLVKVVIMYNYISKMYSDYTIGDNPEKVIKVISEFNESTLDFFRSLPKLTRSFEANWLIQE